MADIFISYQRSRRPLVAYLAQLLESFGLTTWWDYEMSGGAKISPEVEAQIRASKCTIVLWCTASIQSDWVRDEAQEAKKAGVLFPVGLEGVQPPMSFRSDHVLDLSSWSCSIEDDAFRLLIRDLERRLDRKLPVRSKTLDIQRTWQNLGKPLFAPLLGTQSEPDEGAKARPEKSTPASTPAKASSHLTEYLENRLALFAVDTQWVRNQADAEISARSNNDAFGLKLVHPLLRETLEEAIFEAWLAKAKAHQARMVAEQARELVSRADRDDSRFIFTDEGSRPSCVEEHEGTQTGLGYIHKPGLGEYYGSVLDGKVRGLGVYEWYKENEKPDGQYRQEGEQPGENEYGSAILTWRDGFFHAGRVRLLDRCGHGVTVNRDGWKYEGEWQEDSFHGRGVAWTPEGVLSKAGYWDDGEFATAVPPKPST